MVGSPPRMRGKHTTVVNIPQYARITPAHAGKTADAAATTKRHRDHPRACGENKKLPKQQVMLSGSPPRMRGKLLISAGTTGAGGITPAHAGKTFIRWGLRHTIRDHPRACGENWLSDLWGGIKNGSPPRMRGKQGAIADISRPYRITPAHAGKTRGRTVV